MREVAFDTETTGLDLAADRIIEIGCVELINHIPSGNKFQVYINPERSISVESYRIHGLDDVFLADKPVFAAAISGFFEFIGDAPLVAHNAEFDLAFINAELARVGRPKLDPSRVTDSLVLARRRFPAGPNSLDALCSRFGVDLSVRTHHGALIDAALLAEVYIELLGGRQATLAFGEIGRGPVYLGHPTSAPVAVRPLPRPFGVSNGELTAHAGFMAGFRDGGLWAAYRSAAAEQPARIS